MWYLIVLTCLPYCEHAEIYPTKTYQECVAKSLQFPLNKESVPICIGTDIWI